MSSGQAKLEKYDELILALQKFNRDILQSAENMSTCGKVCLDTMGSDELSRNSVAKLDTAVKKYREVTLLSTDLMKKLSSEKEAIRKLIDDSSMEG